MIANRAIRTCLRPIARFFRIGGLAVVILAIGLDGGISVDSAFASPQARRSISPTAAGQKTFASPELALAALCDAAKQKDTAAVGSILGPEYAKLQSGDSVRDATDLAMLVTLADERAVAEPDGPSRMRVIVGKIEWPFPVPLVKDGSAWRFDTAAGVDEVKMRRIGADEISAIHTCRAYALSQFEYFRRSDWDTDSVAEYAQRLSSSPGKRNGLYWPVAKGEQQSPLGPLVASAEALGYTPGKSTNGRVSKPFNGYIFKLLTRQGAYAPGGPYSYIINGNMIGGFALVAYPDKWRSSGVMTFIINQQGRVYEKNLGPNTAAGARRIVEYNPDPSWHLVR